MLLKERDSEVRARQNHADRAPIVSAAAAMALLLLLFVGPFLSGRQYLHTDLAEFHLPLHYLLTQHLWHHELPIWLPELFNGFYAQGEGQLALTHPFHLLLHLVPVDFATQFGMELLLNYLLLIAGTFFYLRHLRLAPAAALFGATTLGFSGFAAAHLAHPNAVFVVAHLPWVLLVASRMLSAPVFPRLPIATLALVCGSMWLGGHPQMAFTVHLVLVILAMTICRASVANLVRVGAAIVLGAFVGAVQWMPTLESLQDSLRAGASDQLIGSWSMHPFWFLQTVGTELLQHPYFEYRTYLGLGVAFLALVAAANWWSDRGRPGVQRFAITLAGVGILTSLGKYGPLWVVLNYLPFRGSARYFLLTQIGITLLASFELHRLLTRSRTEPETKRHVRLWFVFVAVALAAAGFQIGASSTIKLAPYSLSVAAPWLALGAGSLMAALLSQVRTGAVPIFIALSLCDSGSALFGREPFNQVGHFSHSRDEAQVSTAWGRVASSDNRLVVSGLQLTSGYVGLKPRSVLAYREPQELRVAAVQWIDLGPTASHRFARVPDALPRVRLVTRLVETSNVVSQLRAIDPARVALVEPGTAIPALDEIAKGDVRLQRDSSTVKRISVSTTGRALVVLADRFHRGWTGSSNGAPVEIYRVYGDFIGVVVGPGSHVITLKFNPASLWLGALGSTIGMIISGGLLVASRRHDKNVA